MNAVIDFLQRIGAFIIDGMASLGRAVMFLVSVLLGFKEVLKRPGLLIREIYSVGVLSILIIFFSAIF